MEYIFMKKYECLQCSNFCSYLKKVIKLKNVNCWGGGCYGIIPSYVIQYQVFILNACNFYFQAV